MERVSIIVPVYNAEKTISRTIESILNQTYSNIELLLVDDGSTDCSGDICDKYAEAHTNIRVFHVDNGGVSRARNIGLAHLTGDYVGFVDSDDWIEPEMFSTLVEAMKRNNVQMASCEFLNEINGLQNEIHVENQDKVDVKMEIVCGEDMFSGVYHCRQIGGYLWNKLFLKEFIVEKLNEQYLQCEDFLFVLGYIKNIDRFVHVPKKLYHYIRSNEENNYRYSKRALSLLPAYEEVLKVYQEYAPCNVSDIRKQVLKNYLNFRARYKIIKDDDIELKKQINEGTDKYMKKVLADKHVSIKEKVNIVLTYIAPVTMLKAKKKVLYRQRNQGKW